MRCETCGAENSGGAKFCTECGTALPLRCSACGTPHAPDQKFCAECGAALRAAPAPTASTGPTATGPAATGSDLEAPATELRMVSVLFLDLVGFTPLSESRDAEDIRELLRRYFDSSRKIIARYGGAIDKFIGDAVMAVWGAPIAREDDAERAVRAGLELVDAVASFAEEVGAPDLQARAGIVTGQAASMSNPGEGLVVGDRVNTASRAQSAAQPGTVVVDDVTHEVTAPAIAYEDAGEHTVKGKTQPLHLWRALRVVAGVGGSQRELRLEAPLVGRTADLRLLKELFHSALERRAARLIAVSGLAGVGKSRLLWEFDKYVDGLAGTVLWHSGRCLSYGQSAAYWSLAEMIRQRLGIAEDAAPEEALAKLESGLARWIGAADDREFIKPRLGVLLGVSEPGMSRSELFAGWRLFFQRLAEQLPVVLVFEDLQWADADLLDFLEHLLDWSARSPIFILTLARPELRAGREQWPGARRGATLLDLEPLGAESMGGLVDGLVEGLPRHMRRQIIDRAEGIPLYAVETVRVLANRGVLSEGDGELTATADLDDLDVPASLTSLLAARLDALEPLERRLVKAMAVFGATFSRESATALGDVPEEHLDAVLDALVRKQILRIGADPLSPDKGQYVFVQGLLRTVAYDMLSRRERKPRHRAAAEHLRRLFANDGEEVAEVIASHYLDAYRAARGDADAPQLREETIAALRRGAQRAAVVGAPDVAERSYRTASELTVDEHESIELRCAAGEAAEQAGRLQAALELFDEVLAAQRAAGRERDAARVAGRIGRTLSRLGRNEEAIGRLTDALQMIGGGEPDEELAALHRVLGHALFFTGRFQEAVAPLETALQIAQEMDFPVVLSRALIDKGLMCLQDSRPEEAHAHFGAALEIAERHHLVVELMAARGNSGSLGMQWDLPDAASELEDVLALARRQGDRYQESVAAGSLVWVHLFTGRWDEAMQIGDELLEDFEDRPGAEFLQAPLTIVHMLRGELVAARASFAHLAVWDSGDDDEFRAIHRSVATRLQLAEGHTAEALETGRAVIAEAIDALGASHEAVRNAWPDTVEAALELGRTDVAQELLSMLSRRPPGHVPPYLRAQVSRCGALAAIAEERHDAVEAALRGAADGFRELGYPYWLARTQLDLAAWLSDRSESSEAATLLGTARATLESLGAAPALRRADEIESARTLTR